MKQRVWFLALALLFPFCTSSLAKANRFADHPEYKLDRKANPQFLPIGVVQRRRELTADSKKSGQDPDTIAKSGRATGIYISPCLVLTNRHVVYGGESPERTDMDFTFIFSWGIAENKRFSASSLVKPIRITTSGSLRDEALGRDDQCGGKTVGWLNLSLYESSDLVAANAKIFVVSFPGDDSVDSISLSTGTVTGFNSETHNVMYNASTAPGSSGGAVFAYINGEMKWIGIHVGGKKTKNGDNYQFDRYSDEYANEFLNLRDAFGASLIKMIIEDIGKTRNPFDRYSKERPKAIYR